DMSVLSRWFARSDDGRPVVRDARGVTTWSQAIDASEQIARALLDGRRSLDGERVALLAPPGAEFVSCMFGVLRAGGCLVVLSPLHPPPETAYFCADARV